MRYFSILITSFLFSVSWSQEPWIDFEDQDNLEPPPPHVYYSFYSDDLSDSCFFFGLQNMSFLDGDTTDYYLPALQLGIDSLRKRFAYSTSYSGGRGLYQITYHPDCDSSNPVIVRFKEFDGSNWPEAILFSLPQSSGYYEPTFTFIQKLSPELHLLHNRDTSYRWFSSRNYFIVDKSYEWPPIPFEDRALQLINDDEVQKLLTE